MDYFLGKLRVAATLAVVVAGRLPTDYYADLHLDNREGHRYTVSIRCCMPEQYSNKLTHFFIE